MTVRITSHRKLFRTMPDGTLDRLTPSEARIERVAVAIMAADGYAYTGDHFLAEAHGNPRVAKYCRLAVVAIKAMGRS